jgi:hypothetical protein
MRNLREQAAFGAARIVDGSRVGVEDPSSTGA